MKKNKKTHHSFIGNTIYMFKLVLGWDKAQIPVSIGISVFTVAMELDVVSFITALTYCLEHQKGIDSILTATGVILVIQIVASLLNNRATLIMRMKSAKITRHFDVLLAEKIMNLDFEIIEGAEGRDKYQKAKNALGIDGVYGFTEKYATLLTCILFIVVYGTVTVNLNPWLILILTGLEALKLISTAVESYLTDKTKDPIARVDRKLNYINKTSRNFAIGKDIRIFKLRDYLMQMSDYFIGERKFWTNKMYFYYFCSDMIGLVISVGIEIAVFAYLIYAFLKGETSKTELVLFACTITEFTNWISMIGDEIGEFIPLNIKIDNLREFLDIKKGFRQFGGKPLTESTPYEIELRDISFIYPGSDTEILSHINLTIHKGENLAFVGVNGAGKTTLVKLICGLYQPTSGQILLNGVDIADFNRNEYYGIISAVFQEPRFLPCTILENVSMLPEQDSDKERFFRCVEKAGLTEKINAMPQKESTYLVKNVNEDAVELSGGEMQRLLLARALYKNSSILILDEPTAALDPIAENEIYLRYSEISQNKTSIYISHRLSSTRFCDRIVLIDNSRIAEIGTHNELMEQNGKYAEMFHIQSKYYREGDESIEE